MSATRKKNTTDDYLVAGRGVNPWAMALSAVASNNSGYMFVGLIGLTFNEGLTALSLMGGWVVGDYTAWLVGIPKAVRKRSAESGALTIPSLLGNGLEGGRVIAAVAGLIVLVFLGTYAAANLQAFYDQQAARENEQRLEGIRSITYKPSEWIVRGAPIRGRSIQMEMDEDCFAGEGDMYLFASVLNEFFALYATLNSFTKLTVRGVRRGEVYQWPRRLGHQSVL